MITVRGANTRRIYWFEDLMDFGAAEWWVSYRDSQRFICRVWEDQAPELLPPVMVQHTRAYARICTAMYHPVGHKIAIHPKHRTKAVILHELVHAVGYGEHDNGFIEQLMLWMNLYANVEVEKMAIGAAFVGMRVNWR